MSDLLGSHLPGRVVALQSREKLLAALEEEGFTPGAGALSRVRSPIGLAVGAETPEEIAVSILAEIILVKNKGL